VIPHLAQQLATQIHLAQVNETKAMSGQEAKSYKDKIKRLLK